MAFDDDLVLGIDLGGSKIFAALVDDGGRVHGEHAVPAPWYPPAARALAEYLAATDDDGVGQDGDAGQDGDTGTSDRTAPGPLSTGDGVLDRLTDVARRLLLEPEVSGSRVRSVGVGVPGVTTPAGRVVTAPPLGWRKMRLGGRLSDELDLPVRVE